MKRYNIKNVEILDPVDREKLINYYNKADILFLHLNDLPAFKKVLPSKIFEYASFNKPILAGVEGYASSFIKKEVSDCELFNPCDHKSLIIAFNKIINKKKNINRKLFINKFKRANVMQLMAKDILEIVKNE